MAKKPKPSSRSTERCVVCRRTPTDRAHIKSRGAGGTWEDWNIMMLCRSCHITQHSIGWPEFAFRNHQVLFRLQEMGWEVACDERGVRRLQRS